MKRRDEEEMKRRDEEGRSGGRLQRLLAMMRELDLHTFRSRREICETFGISKTQFYKDRETLAALGFRFAFDRERGGYVVLQRPRIPVFQLDLGEFFALAMSLRQISAQGEDTAGVDTLRILRKIAEQAPLEMQGVLRSSLDEIVLRGGFGCEPGVIASLYRAMKEDRGEGRVHRVRVSHRSPRDGGVRQIEFDPYHIFFKKRSLYVDGFRPGVAGHPFRCIRINRIVSVRFTGMLVPIDPSYNFRTRWRHAFYLFPDGPPRRVLIRFDRDVAHYIRETFWHASQRFIEGRGGDLFLELHVSEPREVLWEVLRWGEHAEILEPADLRDEARETAKRLLERYTARGRN